MTRVRDVSKLSKRGWPSPEEYAEYQAAAASEDQATVVHGIGNIRLPCSHGYLPPEEASCGQKLGYEIPVLLGPKLHVVESSFRVAGLIKGRYLWDPEQSNPYLLCRPCWDGDPSVELDDDARVALWSPETHPVLWDAPPPGTPYAGEEFTRNF